jgi:hypothetical protein
VRAFDPPLPAGVVQGRSQEAQVPVDRGLLRGEAGEGLQPYTPTRLQWAALELQALYGNNSMTHEAPLRITFVPGSDGLTVKCLMAYTSDYPAAALKVERDSIDSAFKKYVENMGWPWLRLSIQERPMEKPWPRER